jgi:hypothetical protein
LRKICGRNNSRLRKILRRRKRRLKKILEITGGSGKYAEITGG